MDSEYRNAEDSSIDSISVELPDAVWDVIISIAAAPLQEPETIDDLGLGSKNNQQRVSSWLHFALVCKRCGLALLMAAAAIVCFRTTLHDLADTTFANAFTLNHSSRTTS